MRSPIGALVGEGGGVVRGRDPLYRDAPLSHVREIPVLGITVRFECSAAAVAELIEAAYGQWRSVATQPGLMTSHRVRVRVIGHEGTVPEGDAFPLVSRMPDNEHLLLHTPGSLALADVSRAEGVVYAAPALMNAGERFVAGVLDAVVLMLVTRFDRVPVHAAMLRRDRTAVLLAGPGGTGKSTLAYAASRAGYQACGDDVAYVQLEPEFRVWGVARALRLPLAALRWFPELEQARPTLGPDGDAKLLVPLAPPGAPVAERVAVCLVERAGGDARLESLEAAVVARALMTNLEPGFDRFPGHMEAAVERLAQPGGFRLTLGADPRDALPHVDRMLAALQAQP